MNRFAILDPAMLFADEKSQVENDLAGELITVMEVVNKSPGLVLAWNDEMQALIWQNLECVCGAAARDHALRMQPILYRIFGTLKPSVAFAESCNECDVDPELNCTLQEATVWAYKALYTIHSSCEFIGVFLSGVRSQERGFKFLVDGLRLDPDPAIYHPSAIGFLDEFVSASDISEVVEDASRLKQYIAGHLQKEYSLDAPIEPFSFSSTFLRQIRNANENKQRIVDTIVLRLSKTAREAGRDPRLLEKNLRTGDDIRRFRVQSRPHSTRIHIRYLPDGGFEFLGYYGKGRHDDGL